MAVCGIEPISAFKEALAFSPLALVMYSAISMIISTTEHATYSFPKTDTMTAIEINNSVPIFRSLISASTAVFSNEYKPKAVAASGTGSGMISK